MAETRVLKIECPDEKGLVHRITGVLYRNGLNIVANDEFVDREAGRFFMRTEFAGRADSRKIEKELAAKLPRPCAVRLVEARKKKAVVFATKEPHCVGDLLLRHAYGELHADILAVVSNHDTLRPLAQRFRVRYHRVPHEKRSREDHERALLRVLRRYRFDYLVLAKYLRVFSADFTDRFRGRIINIHHSFLPAFIGADPYRQAAERGVKIIGATAHFVTEDLDRGPIIAQSVVSVDHSQTAGDMAQAGRDVEKIVLAKALKLAFEDRIFVSGNKTVIFD